MMTTDTALFRRYADRANALLVEAGVTTPDAPIVWIREDGVVMVNVIQYRPRGLDLDAARAIGERLHAEFGAESRVGEYAAAWFETLRRAAQPGWSPGDGRAIATDAYYLCAAQAEAAEG